MRWCFVMMPRYLSVKSLKAKTLSLTFCFRTMLNDLLSSVTALLHTATAARHRKYKNGHQRGGFIFAFDP